MHGRWATTTSSGRARAPDEVLGRRDSGARGRGSCFCRTWRSRDEMADVGAPGASRSRPSPRAGARLVSRSKWSSIARFWVRDDHLLDPRTDASSTAYWMTGLWDQRQRLFGLCPGRRRKWVPHPRAGKRLRTHIAPRGRGMPVRTGALPTVASDVLGARPRRASARPRGTHGPRSSGRPRRGTRRLASLCSITRAPPGSGWRGIPRMFRHVRTAVRSVSAALLLVRVALRDQVPRLTHGRSAAPRGPASARCRRGAGATCRSEVEPRPAICSPDRISPRRPRRVP